MAPMPEAVAAETAIRASGVAILSFLHSEEMTVALIWAVGPSRPPEPPEPITREDAMILTAATFPLRAVGS